MVSRYGGKQSIVSNISSGGLAEATWTMLLNYYKGDEEKAFRKLNHMKHLGLQTARQLETSGFHYGNLGMDMGMDQDGKLWIIEINNVYPNHTIALDAEDSLMYRTVMSTPLLYAKWLTGFRS
jgi:hypothetical protein